MLVPPKQVLVIGPYFGKSGAARAGDNDSEDEMDDEDFEGYSEDEADHDNGGAGDAEDE